MDFESGNSQKKCLNNNSNTFCSKNHYLKNIDGEFFIVGTSHFFLEIYRHHKVLVQKRCDVVCPRDIMCNMHFKLQRMEQFLEHVRDKNLNFHKVIRKLAFFIIQTSPRRKKRSGGRTSSNGSGQMSLLMQP